jgi:hypothetical protein
MLLSFLFLARMSLCCTACTANETDFPCLATDRLPDLFAAHRPWHGPWQQKPFASRVQQLEEKKKNWQHGERTARAHERKVLGQLMDHKASVIASVHKFMNQVVARYSSNPSRYRVLVNDVCDKNRV